MIILSDPTANTNIQNIFYKNSSVNVTAGCTIEHNMNQLLDNIVVYTTATDDDYIGTLGAQIIKKNPFTKLFPLNSILRPNRPINPGVKYYIANATDNIDNNKFYNYRTVPYPQSSPRVYYPGVRNYYQYWVSPAGQGINITVKYKIESATVTQAYATGSKIVYTTTQDHGFTLGKFVTISGSGESSINLVKKEIIEIADSKTFAVASNLAATMTAYTSLNKTATLVDSTTGNARPTKSALANKIVVKFEKYHYLPATCTVVITYSDNTTASPSAFNVPSDGNLSIYYNGSTWSTSAPFNSTQPISYPTPKEIKSINIATPSAGSEKIIGLIEVSARWIQDLSSDVVSFTIDKESTSNPEDILPVGNITANNLALELAKYNENYLPTIAYNRDNDWETTPSISNAIYLYKNSELKPHFKVYHSAGKIVDGTQKYDIVPQGYFYIDDFTIQEFGNVSINALDASRFLMDTLSPDLIYSNAPATSVMMGILDSIGFTNYNFNVVLDNSNKLIDTSIPTLVYWWSDDSKTVWDALQELCRDFQINCFVDENNVLQFYTRDYMYNRSSVNWEFYYETPQGGDKLPNIINFNKKEILSANQVKVIWKVPMSSLYSQGAEDLWSSEPSFLISGGLRYDIEANTPAENINFDIDIDNLDPYVKYESVFNFSGYMLVDSEIFEYDAVQFEYLPVSAAYSDPKIKVWLSSQGDWAKYRALSKTGSEYFKPTGVIRIKRRGVFRTQQAKHFATASVVDTWNKIEKDVWR